MADGDLENVTTVLLHREIQKHPEITNLVIFSKKSGVANPRSSSPDRDPIKLKSTRLCAPRAQAEKRLELVLGGGNMWAPRAWAAERRRTSARRNAGSNRSSGVVATDNIHDDFRQEMLSACIAGQRTNHDVGGRRCRYPDDLLRDRRERCSERRQLLECMGPGSLRFVTDSEQVPSFGPEMKRLRVDTRSPAQYDPSGPYDEQGAAPAEESKCLQSSLEGAVLPAAFWHPQGGVRFVLRRRRRRRPEPCSALCPTS